MPRSYKRKPGGRRYTDYTKDKLEECLETVSTGNMSQRKAEVEFRIPRLTIKNKLKNRHLSSVGRPTVFSEAEEASFAQHMIKLCDFYYFVNDIDFRNFSSVLSK